MPGAGREKCNGVGGGGGPATTTPESAVRRASIPATPGSATMMPDASAATCMQGSTADGPASRAAAEHFADTGMGIETARAPLHRGGIGDSVATRGAIDDFEDVVGG